MAIHIQISHLVTSNVSAAVARAADPAKMLKLLRREIEDAIVAVQGNLPRGERQHQRLLESAERIDASAAQWNGKAQTAIDHDRKDLARAALLSREEACTRAENEREAAEKLGPELTELRSTMSKLEARLREVGEELANCTDTRQMRRERSRTRQPRRLPDGPDRRSCPPCGLHQTRERRARRCRNRARDRGIITRRQSRGRAGRDEGCGQEECAGQRAQASPR